MSKKVHILIKKDQNTMTGFCQKCGEVRLLFASNKKSLLCSLANKKPNSIRRLEYLKYKEHIKAYLRKYRSTLRSKKTARTYQKYYIRKVREETLNLLGGKCVKCGFNDKRALQIDHINGGGNKERKDGLGFGMKFNKHVTKSFLKNEDKYQLLCANCNWIKRSENNEARGYCKKQENEL
jgi:hypothetical protein